MINNNKGFLSLLLIFVFLNACFVKSISAGAPKFKISETERRESGSKQDLSAISDTDSESGFFDQLKKGLDTDDLEFAFFGTFSSKPIAKFQRQQQFTDVNMRPEIYRGSLYDLYCNWKFHLA